MENRVGFSKFPAGDEMPCQRATGQRLGTSEREREREPFLNCAQRSRDLIALLRRIFVPPSRSILHCRERLEILNLIGLLFVPIGGGLCAAGAPNYGVLPPSCRSQFSAYLGDKNRKHLSSYNSHVTSQTADANAFLSLSLWSNFRPSV